MLAETVSAVYVATGRVSLWSTGLPRCMPRSQIHRRVPHGDERSSIDSYRAGFRQEQSICHEYASLNHVCSGGDSASIDIFLSPSLAEPVARARTESDVDLNTGSGSSWSASVHVLGHWQPRVRRPTPDGSTSKPRYDQSESRLAICQRPVQTGNDLVPTFVGEHEVDGHRLAASNRPRRLDSKTQG
jgi:hypothetical protein